MANDGVMGALGMSSRRFSFQGGVYRIVDRFHVLPLADGDRGAGTGRARASGDGSGSAVSLGSVDRAGPDAEDRQKEGQIRRAGGTYEVNGHGGVLPGWEDQKDMAMSALTDREYITFLWFYHPASARRHLFSWK